ncbi:hypothetical protein, partial [Fischerella thermalis]
MSSPKRALSKFSTTRRCPRRSVCCSHFKVRSQFIYQQKGYLEVGRWGDGVMGGVNSLKEIAEFGHEWCLSTFCRDVALLRL